MPHAGIQPANHGCSIQFQSIYIYLVRLHPYPMVTMMEMHPISHGNNDGHAILLLVQCIEAKEMQTVRESVATAYMHATCPTTCCPKTKNHMARAGIVEVGVDKCSSSGLFDLE